MNARSGEPEAVMHHLRRYKRFQRRQRICRYSPDSVCHCAAASLRQMRTTRTTGWTSATTRDFIKIRFDFWTAFCVSAKFGSYAARNMFP
jgi:hypothetical protein